MDVESQNHGHNLPTKISYAKLMLDQGVLTKDVVEWEYEGSGTEEDPYVVDWIHNDARNPMTWSTARKWTGCASMALATLVVAFCSSAFSGGIQKIMIEMEASQTLVTAGISLFVLGFALGPLLWAPFSELYGRQIIFFFTFGAMVAFNAGAAGAQNIWTLLILRFFAGSFGSSPLTNAGGVIADLFNAKERGMAMAIFSVAPFMGPVLGPIVSGFLGMTEGWRWVEGLMAIFSGVIWILATFTVPETYAPVLQRKRAAALSKLTGKVYRSRGDIAQGTVTLSEAFGTGMKRPWILLFREPIVFLLSLYMAVIYGTLYLLFGAFPIVYRFGRGWNEGVSGLPFIGVAIGMFAALIYTSTVDYKRYLKAIEKSGTGFAAPEARLHGAMVGGTVLPIGLFWFAWTNSPSLPWPASVAAAIPFGFGMVLIFLAVMNYFVDAYTIFAASVLAASGIIRSLFGAAFPLFTVDMYTDLGIHWASMIPACLSLVCAIFPFILYKYGAQIRSKCKFAAESEAFMNGMRARAAAAAAAAAAREDADPTGVDSETSSQTAPVNEERSQHGESGPRFEEMKTGEEAQQDKFDLEKVHTYRSTGSTRSVMPTNEDVYDVNPYAIDRVNTRESMARMNSRTSRHSRK